MTARDEAMGWRGGPARARAVGRALTVALALLAVASWTGAGRALGVPEGPGPAPVGRPLEFDSEVVRITVLPDSVEVDGFYRFLSRRSGAPMLTILYPFPADSVMGGARMVSVEGRSPATAWRPIPWAEARGFPGATWGLPTLWGDTLEVRSVYRQARRGHHARYIVTSTTSWGRALRSARFEVILEPGATPTRFSFPFHRASIAGREGYGFEAVDFLPDHDIEVEWSE